MTGKELFCFVFLIYLCKGLWWFFFFLIQGAVFCCPESIKVTLMRCNRTATVTLQVGQGSREMRDSHAEATGEEASYR